MKFLSTVLLLIGITISSPIPSTLEESSAIASNEYNQDFPADAINTFEADSYTAPVVADHATAPIAAYDELNAVAPAASTLEESSTIGSNEYDQDFPADAINTFEADSYTAPVVADHAAAPVVALS